MISATRGPEAHRVTLDASVWLAAGFVDEPGHHDAMAVLSHVVRRRIALEQPTLFLAEVAGAVRRRTGDTEAGVHAVARVVALDTVRLHGLDEPTARTAAALAAQLGLRGADAVYLAHATTLGAELITLDQEMCYRGRPLHWVGSPAEWLVLHGSLSAATDE